MKIKVMIVDDSLFMRAMIRHILECDEKERFEVVANAMNGEDALRKLETEDIDVITLDVEMPKKNGLETLKEIMKIKPKPVVMLSSLTKPAADVTIEALANHAVDFITKPTDEKNIKEIKSEILEKLYTASKAKLRIRSYEEVKLPERKIPKPSFTSSSEKVSKILAIGTSTGGPHALREIMPQFPGNFHASVLIAQHMPEGNFTSSLAKHLDQISNLTVKEAEDGEELKEGYAYLAPGGKHMEVYDEYGKIKIKIHTKPSLHKPSVDFLFQSMALLKEVKQVAVVLTGMGSDGTIGARYLKNSGAKILSEDESTCVVYGMPRKIAENNLSDGVEPLHKIIPKALSIL